MASSVASMAVQSGLLIDLMTSLAQWAVFSARDVFLCNQLYFCSFKMRTGSSKGVALCLGFHVISGCYLVWH
ncbi:hypothetical protein EDC04DRAFT_2686790 [Pisolithus marmoratus]|nr:hypothetical protein EDC04DRAFT_2686790 [Pisolithus marmoratus]